MTRGDIVEQAMVLADAEWDRLHEWFFSDRPLHESSQMIVSKLGKSDYAVAYTAYATDLAAITRFHANADALALITFGKHFEVTGE